jgi:ubiquinone/menaquinone biosynthesis C-methylase UbiE
MKLQYQTFNQEPVATIQAQNKEVFCFDSKPENQNIDHSVVDSFGEEWKKFHEFSEADIERTAKVYFDILNEKIINQNTYGIDIGCGTGRWTKYLLDKIGFMEALDPSDAIFAADRLLAEKENVRLIKSSADNIPFNDETFDFGMSIGVLHHIPDTQKAMTSCIKKIKKGGYFYTYLYYNLENKGGAFKALLSVVTAIRKRTSALSPKLKKTVCDFIAVSVYMPFVLSGRVLKKVGLNSLARKLPLNDYQTQSFYIIRNDALDRFGTSLEHRFSRAEVEQMMRNAGLDEIVISNNSPFWHAVGKRVK